LQKILNQFALTSIIHQIYVDEQDNVGFMHGARRAIFQTARVEDYPINLDEEQ